MPLAALGSLNHAFNFVWGRNVASYLKDALLARIPLDRNVAGNVLMVGRLRQRFEAGESLPRQGAGGVLKEIITDPFDSCQREFRELCPADLRQDMQIDVLSILPDGRALGAVRLYPLDPSLCGFGHG